MSPYCFILATPSCPVTSVTNNNTCYWMTQSTSKMKYLQAIASCRQEAGTTTSATLAMIKTQDIETEILTLDR